MKTNSAHSVHFMPCTGNDPFTDLALAVIHQAAEDYRSLGKKLVKLEKEEDPEALPEQKKCADCMKAISRFFLSDWYSSLSGIDNGSLVLEELDKEVFGKDDCA